MDIELRWLFALVFAVVISLTLIGVGYQYFDYLKSCEAMKSGYSQQTVQGEQGVYWVKNGEVMK